MEIAGQDKRGTCIKNGGKGVQPVWSSGFSRLRPRLTRTGGPAKAGTPNVVAVRNAGQARVKEWAECLIADGIEGILDIYDLNEGDDKFVFMEKMVTQGATAV